MTAVTAVGLAEGSSHVNWKKVQATLVWYAVGFAAVMVSTYGLVAQGKACWFAHQFKLCQDVSPASAPAINELLGRLGCADVVFFHCSAHL